MMAAKTVKFNIFSNNCKPFILSVILIGVIAVFLMIGNTFLGGRNFQVLAYLRNPDLHRDWEVTAKTSCAGSVFQMPTTGYIGYLWGDSFKLLKRHQGIDIFGGTTAGETAVYAPYDGFLTRQSSWKSSLIIRVPSDPLQPGRQIWLYMTHLADAQGNSFISEKFPAGVSEVPISAGDFLGYQGDFSGDPNNPVGVHLHFSIVKDDGKGRYLNELEIDNTIDPSPYFNLELNAAVDSKTPPICKEGNY